MVRFEKHKRGAAVLPFGLKKTIAMVGMMGAGKTAIGAALAKRLGVPFLDSDTEIEAAANMSVAEIFTRYGEAFFREKETQVIARLLDGKPAVLSTGGGAYLAEGNRKMISERGVAVWLRADLELLWERVRHKTTRPLLNTPDPKSTLRQLYEDRTPIYQMADLIIEADPAFSIEDMTDHDFANLKTRTDVLGD